MDKIIFNLDLDEYESDFLLLQETAAERNGLWQQQASARLAERLDEMGRAARKYKKRCLCEPSSTEKLSCYHHAIFISGSRGAGKTVFLRNAEAIWGNFHKDTDNKPELYFIDTIDPTLLDVDDRFSEVIIASVYAAVEKKLKLTNNTRCQEECYKDKFFRAFQNLSNALGKASEFDELRGIDRIQKYRSGIHLERYFHQFLIASVNLLGCDALVLPIDDVDMKIDNAFGVLDDIRRLLSCPLILPIVSGDDDLYRHAVTMKFEGLLASKKDASNFIQGQENAVNLSDAYLTKIFPVHNRIPLQPIYQLLPMLSVQYEKQDQEMSYDDYQKYFMAFFYAYCRDVEYRKLSVVSNKSQWLQPQNARELVQRLKLFRPDEIKSMGLLSNKVKLWQRFKNLAEIKRAGQALVDAISYLAINEINQEALSLHNLISFNPIIQSNTYSWGEYDFYVIQNDARAKVNKSQPAYENGKTVNLKNHESRINSLWEMPPVDFKKFYFTNKNDNKESNEKIKKLKLIYSFSENNGRYEVVFGRAFEMLFWSILFVTGNIECSDDGKGVFDGIFKRYPFYSYLVFDADDIGVGGYHVLNNSDSELVAELSSWVKNNKGKISGEVKGKNLIPLMSEVFFNVFSQIYRMKVEPDFDISDEYLPDIARRFEYIFMNSLLCCMKIDRIMHIDVAVRDASEKFESRTMFLDSNENLKKNIEDILELKNEHFINKADNTLSDIGTFLEVMWRHPIFQLPYGAGSCCKIKNN